MATDHYRRGDVTVKIDGGVREYRIIAGGAEFTFDDLAELIAEHDGFTDLDEFYDVRCAANRAFLATLRSVAQSGSGNVAVVNSRDGGIAVAGGVATISLEQWGGVRLELSAATTASSRTASPQFRWTGEGGHSPRAGGVATLSLEQCADQGGSIRLEPSAETTASPSRAASPQFSWCSARAKGGSIRLELSAATTANMLSVLEQIAAEYSDRRN